MPTVPAERVRVPGDLAPLLEHTLLAPGAGAADLARLCAEARAHALGAVCLHRELIPEARRLLAGAPVRAVSVVDFPEGRAGTAARVAEALEAVRAGADELDVVAPLPALLAGRWEAALEDLRAVVRAVPVPVKVILETARLATRDAKVAAAAVAAAAGAAWVKTSTGFGGGGATAEDVALLRAVVGEGGGVKASGGIRTAAQALAMVRAGADRIGSSACAAIVTGTF